jgi:hypothetical protein
VKGPVHTLVVDCGRRPGDGLPAGARGARLLCYVAAADEAAAVREAVAVLRDAGMAPLDVTGYGTLDERLAEGEIAEEERAMIAEAEAGGALVVGEVTPLYGEEAPSSGG